MTPALTIEHEIGKLNEFFATYWKLTGKGIRKSLAKVAKEFRDAFYIELRTLKPRPGMIKESNLREMKRGRGLRIHQTLMPNVFGGGDMNQEDLIQARLAGRFDQKRRKNKLETNRAKRLYKKAGLLARGNNPGTAHALGMQALRAENELRLRESKRGFLSMAVRMGYGDFESRVVSKSNGTNTGSGVNNAKEESGDFTFTWGDGVSRMSRLAAKGLMQPWNQQAAARAVRAANEQMHKHLENKMAKAAREQEAMNA